MEGGFIDRYMQRWVDGHMERRQHGNKTQQFLHLSECVRSNPTPLQKNAFKSEPIWQSWVRHGSCEWLRLASAWKWRSHVTCVPPRMCFFDDMKPTFLGAKRGRTGWKTQGTTAPPTTEKMIEMTVWFKGLETTAFCGKYRRKWNMVTQTQITRGLSKTVTISFLPSELEYVIGSHGTKWYHYEKYFARSLNSQNLKSNNVNFVPFHIFITRDGTSAIFFLCENMGECHCHCKNAKTRCPTIKSWIWISHCQMIQSSQNLGSNSIVKHLLKT